MGVSSCISFRSGNQQLFIELEDTFLRQSLQQLSIQRFLCRRLKQALANLSKMIVKIKFGGAKTASLVLLSCGLERDNNSTQTNKEQLCTPMYRSLACSISWQPGESTLTMPRSRGVARARVGRIILFFLGLSLVAIPYGLGNLCSRHLSVADGDKDRSPPAITIVALG